jgi:CRP-like cAMP-binding protein
MPFLQIQSAKRMITLINWLHAINPISNELFRKLEELAKIRILAKKSYLLHAGQVCNNIYFVEKGMLWQYYLQGGKTISSAFSKENEICISMESFYTQKYGIESIQALEDSRLFYIRYQDYHELTQKFPEFNTLARRMLEKCSVLREQRMTALWMQSAEDRVNWLVNQYPDLMQRVPGKCLASYLGMTAVMLSRIRGKPRVTTKA